jgi:propionyl-CoA carboxylase alpha chain
VFGKILIANRGEIALRIIRTCRRLGVKTVAVYSESDLRSPHVQEADERFFIGEARARDSYLDREKILCAALERSCQAIHPGYGFLSENAHFAKMVADAGIVFIGPPAGAIATLGDKMASKELAARAGVPVVPAQNVPASDPETLKRIAEQIDYPVLVKPAAGGGGRGLRIVTGPAELPSALRESREETRKSFGEDRVFLERYISKARHIEVQILADSRGNIIHLGERECSVQRRYQKVIEETPSTAVNESTRAEMGRVACALAREAGYANAGTVEFILDRTGKFYFLEMNTRLQVEHPVTEMVTGLDLVELQLRIAAGEELPLTQEQVASRGWAMEARVCAEDPFRGFLPTTGIITSYSVPRGRDIRVDSGIQAGSVVTIFYDSLLAKVAAWGPTREAAASSLGRALNGCHIEGVVTNVDFCNAVIHHPAFRSGDLSTDFLKDHFTNGISDASEPIEFLHHMVIAGGLVLHTRRALVRESLKSMSPPIGAGRLPPYSTEYVASVDSHVFRLRMDGDQVSRVWRITVDDRGYEVLTPQFEYHRRRLLLKINGVSHMFRLQYQDHHIRCSYNGLVKSIEVYTPREWELAPYMLRAKKEARDDVLKCPMPGLITAIHVEEGVDVCRGQELIRMESMKMETAIASPVDGRVEAVLVKPGEAVEADQILMKFRK